MNYKNWYSNKRLTTDWLSKKLPYWFAPLSVFIDKDCVVLEIGVYEGRSVIAFLEYLPRSTVTAVDIFVDSRIEKNFDFNMDYYPGRFIKIKTRAAIAMDQLLSENKKFDVIYLDTGKNRTASWVNSTLAWPLLSNGGVLIWDDVTWGRDRTEESRPGPGIRMFANQFRDCMDILHDGEQLIVRKTRDWPNLGSS